MELKRTQPLTARELGGIFNVSANAVRRHLKELEADGLVTYTREQRGSGAPTYAYRLSANGEGLFPTQYGKALFDVLTYVAAHEGREMVRELFAEQFRGHADRLRAGLRDATLEEKVRVVADFLTEQGFMAVWSVDADAVRLAEHHCAIRDVAEQFPEICAAEADFLREVLQTEVHRDTYIPDGCNACEYSIITDASRSPVDISVAGEQENRDNR